MAMKGKQMLDDVFARLTEEVHRSFEALFQKQLRSLASEFAFQLHAHGSMVKEEAMEAGLCLENLDLCGPKDEIKDALIALFNETWQTMVSNALAKRAHGVILQAGQGYRAVSTLARRLDNFESQLVDMLNHHEGKGKNIAKVLNSRRMRFGGKLAESTLRAASKYGVPGMPGTTWELMSRRALAFAFLIQS